MNLSEVNICHAGVKDFKRPANFLTLNAELVGSVGIGFDETSDLPGERL